jgi:hypothetical protein
MLCSPGAAATWCGSCGDLESMQRAMKPLTMRLGDSKLRLNPTAVALQAFYTSCQVVHAHVACSAAARKHCCSENIASPSKSVALMQSTALLVLPRPALRFCCSCNPKHRLLLPSPHLPSHMHTTLTFQLHPTCLPQPQTTNTACQCGT